MDPVSEELKVSIPNMRMGMMGGVSTSPTLQHCGISNKKMEHVSNSLGLQNSIVLNKSTGQLEPQVSNPGIQQFFVPNQQVGHREAMSNNLGSPKTSLPSKRNAAGESISSSSVAQPLSMPNKNSAHVRPFTSGPVLQQLSTPNNQTVQMDSKHGIPISHNLPAPTKKMVRNDSTSGRSGTKQVQTQKNRSTQVQQLSKVQTDSFESVRSKMRESLASALDLVTQKQDKALDEENDSVNKGTLALGQMQQDSYQADADHVSENHADSYHVSENHADSLALKESCSAYKGNDDHNASLKILASESICDSSQTRYLIQGKTACPSEDIPSKDELLPGNGLAWALDLDVDAGKRKEIQIAQKPELVNVGEKAVQSPKSLALKIEVELFKLFGGVNRKYREKGRSLLFNLKDQSNPELRERVMSGEISPERLCSMTAEELASEELSQWRIAKAEELAQMVVLPDSDVDIRRLVRKTHKGEFQVEVEQDDGVSVEVSVGTASLILLHSENKDTEVHPSPKADEIKDKENVVGEKSSSENQELSCSVTIPNDGNDLMQGLMVDEFKDAEFLPPIVSLDEFMESLDSEPPFENLPVDGGKVISPSDKESSDIGAKDPEGATAERSDKVDVKDTDSDLKTKSRDSPVEPKSCAPAAASKGDLVWEGVLQLNISAMVTVVGFFSSGEKTTTKEWPNSLDIKGRVRLDAFEKFLKELPMSRSRAVMVVHFGLKDGSSENDHSSLSEVVYSYVSDERLGFAEPAPGVEIYFCPPHAKIVEILTKHLSKDHNEILNSFDSGLIGIIVWRKAHSSSTIFPNSKSHKHSSKRQHFAPRGHQEKDSNVNVNLVTKQQTKIADDSDDIPPGFGPGVARDEEDLPEFNFSGATNRSLPKHFNQAPSEDSHLPVDQRKQLIQQYGQLSSHIDPRNLGIGIQRWNDDEDDIPEWQPEALPQQQLRTPPSQPMLNFQPLMPHQFHMAAQSPVNMMQGGGIWSQPHVRNGFPPNINLGSQPSSGQYYGVPVAGQPPNINLGSQPSGGQYYGVPVAGQPAIDYRLEADTSRGF